VIWSAAAFTAKHDGFSFAAFERIVSQRR
jgi:hypothetical protein